MLEIMLGVTKIGSLLLNGPYQTRLVNIKLKEEHKGLAKNNLLIKGQDYQAFGYEGYVKSLSNYLKKNLGEQTYLQEKPISEKIQRLLMKKHSMA